MDATTWHTAPDNPQDGSAEGQPSSLLVQGSRAPATQPQDTAVSTGADQPNQLLLQSLLSSYGPAVMVPPPSATVQVVAQQKRSEIDEIALQALQSTLSAAITTAGAGFQQVNITQPTQLAVVQQQPQTMPVGSADAMQLAALLAAMQDPQQQLARYAPGRGSHSADPLAVAGGLVSKTSSGELGGVPSSAREKNRQAQQRFRQRQKDRIQELEDMNKVLQDKLSGCEAQLSELRDENKLLRAKLESQLLENFQGLQQQAGLLTVQLPGVQ